jgi:ethanolaminephosphotransferase
VGKGNVKLLKTDEDLFDWFKLTPYISPQGRINMPLYQYRAKDFGKMYIHFFNPFGNWLVNYFPESLAPNVITLTGFIFSITPFFVMVYLYSSHFYNPEGVEDLPAWLFYMQGVCFFIYRLLDEIDGKQARRTGNSSPLGLLFDHGFDAYSIGIVVLFFCKAIQLGDSYKCMLITAGINFVFHVTTIEQYYTGELILSAGNFVSDGAIPVSLGFFAIGYYGNSWWTKDIKFTDSFSIKPNHIFLYIMYTAVFLNTIESIHTTYKKLTLQGKAFPWVGFASQLLGYIMMIGSSACLIFVGKNPIYNQDWT